MAKYLIGVGIGEDPTFNASAKTITFDSSFQNKHTNSPIEFIINNKTNKLIYKKGKAGVDGSWDKATGVLTLDYDTSADGSADGDSLHAWADISDGKRGVDFLSQMYVDGMIAANNDDVESRLAQVSADIETMTADQNARLDTLAEIPDSIIVETAASEDGREVQIIDNAGTKEVHVVDFGVTALTGYGKCTGGSATGQYVADSAACTALSGTTFTASLAAYSDLIVAVKGIGDNTVDVVLKEDGVVKVPTFPLAQADNIDARADLLSVDSTNTGASVGGKVQVTLVKNP